MDDEVDYTKMTTEELLKLSEEYDTLATRYNSLQLAQKILLDLLG